MMKEIASVMVLLALCVPALAVDIPNMVGNWTGTAHGADWYRYSTSDPIGKPIYWSGNYTIAISEQNGTAFSGKFINDAHPEISRVMLGVIGSDNKTIAMVAETTSYWGWLKSPTEMELFGSSFELESQDVGVCTFKKE